MPLELIGSSPQMFQLRDAIEKLRSSSISVLLQGESGTGKDVVARLIQNSKGPYKAFSCACLPYELAEAYLFGVSAGIVGGPSAGLLAGADGGTLFLDEIECLGQEAQMHLLRALQERNFQPVGSTLQKPFEVRLISATNTDLAEQVKRGNFQPDLYHHLSAVTLFMPPLRARRQDIPELIDFFMNEYATQFGRRSPCTMSAECYAALGDYDWPGNVRELQNAIRHLLVMSSESTVGLKDLPEKFLALRGQNSSRQQRVFLCHSSADKKSVRDLYYKLRSRGIAPWLDEVDLLPGQEWQAEIARAVRASNVVLVCLSGNSITKEGFVQKEIKIALDVADEKPDGKIFIIPTRLESCDVPERLRRWQWVDLFERDGFGKLISALAAGAGDKR